MKLPSFFRAFEPWRRPILAGLATASLTASAPALPVPIFGEGPVGVERLRVNNPAVLPMTGSWKFQVTNGEQHGETFVPTFNSVSATSEQHDHKAIGALGGPDAYWSPSNGDLPQTWQVDMGDVQSLAGLRLELEDRNFTYDLKVETSRDGGTWTPLADSRQIHGERLDVSGLRAQGRYLRVVFNDVTNPSDGKKKWAFIRRIQIMVQRDGRTTAWAPGMNSKESKLANFAALNFDDRTFATIPVPSNWEILGFSKPTYDSPDRAVGLYRRIVTVPAAFASRRVLWHFDGVFDSAEVFVNGKRVGIHESGFTAFDLDVTAFVKPGAPNLFAVRVCKNTGSYDLDTGDYWALGGIYRDNYLVSLPLTHVSDTTIVTDLDSAYKNATLHATVTVAGPPGQPFEASSQLYAFDGKKAATPEMKQTGVLNASGQAILKLSQPVAAPKLWSAEKPNLYYLVTTLAQNGQRVEQTQERFGFKEIEIKQGVVLWNGVPIKCAGVCRHEEWAAFGHALGEKQWQTDIALIKAANINAVRTSHYIDAERFLELCDEKGLYVLNEIPYCWANPSDENFRSPLLLRTNEAYARDKNRPSILAWSVGNESDYGPVNLAGFERIKVLDPTRPAFISGCLPSRHNPRLDFSDTHYPGVDRMKEYVADPERKKAPLVITEGPHIFYLANAYEYDYAQKDFWVYSLINQWKYIWPNDSMLGAFIWEWQDQGLVDKFPDRSDVDAQGYRFNNHKGFVDGYRNLKPEYYNVKMVYSPVVVPGRNFEITGGKIKIPVQNRYSFTNFSELTCRWEALAGDKKLATGVQPIDCAPRSSGTATFDAVPGMDALRLEFVHPDGRSIYYTRLDLKGTSHPAPPAVASSGLVLIREAAGALEITAGATKLTVRKATGAIVSWTVAGQPLLTGGFILNLGKVGGPQDGDERDFIFNKVAPELTNPGVSAKMDGTSAVVTVSNDVSVPDGPQWNGKLRQTLTIRPDGQIAVAWALDWTGDDARTWDLGLKLPLPKTLDRMHWRRDGLWTEYPKDHIAATVGDAGPTDLTFGCTKRDLQWLTMSAPGQKYALCLINDGKNPLHTRARLENKELVLSASEASAVVTPHHDFAHGLILDYVIHLRHGETYHGGFDLRAIATP